MPFRCPHCNKVVSTKQPGDLTPREQQLFDLIAEAKGRFVSADYLIYEFWIGQNKPEPESARNQIDIYVWRIRQKRGQLSIRCRQGMGYAYNEEHDNEKTLGTYCAGLEQVQARNMA